MSFLLIALALTGLPSCREPDSAGPSAAFAVGPGTVTLTYICGNSFRVRNTNPFAVTVTWDVYKTTETGTLTLAPKPASAAYSEIFFTTVGKGTVRLSEGGTVIQTKANGNKPPCTIPSDTTRPALPNTGFVFPADTNLVVAAPGATETRFYRNIFRIRFDDSASGATVRRILQEHRGEIIGGLPNTGAYVVRFPDPGSTFAALDSLRLAIKSSGGVEYAAPMEEHSGYSLPSRYPTDGSLGQRASWMTGPNDFTRPRLQVRAPLAWGCETGTYGSTLPSIGVIDFYLDKSSPDFPNATNLSGGRTTIVYPATVAEPWKGAANPKDYNHGTGVSAIIVGKGNNDQALAGMMWDANLTFFALSRDDSVPAALGAYLAETILPEAGRRGIKVLSSSVLIGSSSNIDAALELKRALRTYAASGGLFIQSTGNENSTITPQALLALTSPDIAILQATAALLLAPAETPDARDHFLLVGGTDEDGDFWEGSNFFVGITEILAPAQKVTTLAVSGSAAPAMSSGLQTADGTSFAAPFVAGTAGLLLAMDPTLSAGDLKHYIVAGAQERREKPQTGELIEPPFPRRVPGGEQVRQLDAYGSLKLLSRSRAGTPICGLQVSSVIERSTPEPIVVSGAPERFTSIAQGGRLAANNYRVFRLEGGQWRLRNTYGADTSVSFLEQDTAYVRIGSSYSTAGVQRSDLYVSVASAKPDRVVHERLLTPLSAYPSGSGTFGYASYDESRVRIAPTGDYVYFTWRYYRSNDCYDNVPPSGGTSAGIGPLRGGSEYTFFASAYTNPPCDTPADDFPPQADGQYDAIVAWAPEGEEFYYGRIFSLSPPQLEKWSIANSVVQFAGPSAPAAGNVLRSLVWSPERARLLSAELQYYPLQCSLRTRAAAAPGAIISTIDLGSQFDVCANDQFGPNFLRVPSAIRAAKAGLAAGARQGTSRQPPRARQPMKPSSLQVN